MFDYCKHENDFNFFNVVKDTDMKSPCLMDFRL